MKILISGAGIAGLTLAYWLKRYGFIPTIVERAPSLLTGGYKIDVRGSALQVLQEMDIYDEVLAESTQMQGALLVDKEGKVINKMSGDAFGHREGSDVEIIRGALCQILMNQIPDVECIFGDSIRDISQVSEGVQVKFQKHSSLKFDLVIGADGLHSNVRRIVFGDEASFLRDLGLYLCVYTVPNYLNLNRLEMQYSELGRVAAVWSAHGEPNMKACFGFTAPSVSIDLQDREQQQQIIRDIYNGINWEVPTLLKMMPDASDFYFDAASQIVMDTWYLDRVALVGDAGYCASPMSGQGTSLALIGAYVLAGELAAAKGDYQIAFKNYQSELSAFVKINQELGVTAAKIMKTQKNNGLINWILNQVMRLAPGQLIKFFLDLSTRRIQRAANSIKLKSKYSK